MATYPARREVCGRALATLVDQFDHIYLYLNQYDEIPAEYAQANVTCILSQDTEAGDLRDLGKFYFIDSLQDDVVFLVDDDIHYPDDYGARMTEALDRLAVPSVVGLHGRIMREGFADYFSHSRLLHFQHQLVGDILVDVLGTGTVAFVPGLVGVTFDRVAAKGMADIDLAIIARQRHVPLVAIARPAMWMKDLSTQTGVDESSLYEEYRLRGEEPAELLRAGATWGVDGFAELLDHAFAAEVPLPLKTVIASAISADYHAAGEWRAQYSQPAAHLGSCATSLASRALRGAVTPDELVAAIGGELNGYEASYLVSRLLAPMDAVGATRVWESAAGISGYSRIERVLVGRALLDGADLSSGGFVAMFEAVADALPLDDSEVGYKMAIRLARKYVRTFLKLARAAMKILAEKVPRQIRAWSRRVVHGRGVRVTEIFATDALPDVRDVLVRGLSFSRLETASVEALWRATSLSGRLRVMDKATVARGLSSRPGAAERFADVCELAAGQRAANLPTLLTLQEISIHAAETHSLPDSARERATTALESMAGKTRKRGKGTQRTLFLAWILQNVNDGASRALAKATPWPADLDTEASMLREASTPLDSLNALWSGAGLEPVSRVAALEWRANSPEAQSAPPTAPVMTSGPPRIAVCIAAYNSASTVRGAVESILNQTITDIEIFCVDDGSQDETYSILRDMATADDRIRVLQTASPQGPYGIRNLVLAHTTAPYFAIADSDDWSHPQRFERQLQRITESGALVIMARHIRVAQGRFIYENSGRLFGDGLSSALYDVNIFDKLGKFLPTRSRGDVEFITRTRKLLGRSVIKNVGLPLVLAQHNLASNSHQFDMTELREFRKRWMSFHSLAGRQPGDLGAFMRDNEATLFPSVVPPSMRIR